MRIRALIPLFLLFSVFAGTSITLEVPPLPPRGENYDSGLWSAYIKNVLDTAYPLHRKDIQEIAIFVYERDDAYLGSSAEPGNYEIIITHGLIELIDSPLEFAVLLGHELGHITKHHRPWGDFIFRLALESKNPTQLFRWTVEEFEADLFGVTQISGVDMADSACVAYSAYVRLEDKFAHKPPKRNEAWHVQERIEILRRWCERAKEDRLAREENEP